ncbi:MAG TPA: hypothetical protein VGL93_17255 [Streptosporangiaceae bacterium]|jgi:hypothetical protein
MTISDGLEFRLDTEHIRDVCRAVMPDATVNVTHVDYPSAAYLDVDDKHRAAQALRQVGYDTDLPNGELRVRGWSEPGLRARRTSMIGTLERLHQNLPDAAARAVDACATRFPHEDKQGTVETARNSALAAVRDMLHHEIDTVAGPHANHDPQIRPADCRTAGLFDQTRRLEDAIGRGLDLAQTVAAYAIETYIQLRLHDCAGPSAARRGAIARTMARISSDSRHRAYADPGADRPPPAASPSGNDAARLAATDVPQPATGASQTVAGDAAPPVRSPAPDRTPHRRAS